MNARGCIGDERWEVRTKSDTSIFEVGTDYLVGRASDNERAQLMSLAPILLKALRATTLQLNACMESMDEMLNENSTPTWIKEACSTRRVCGEPELERALAVIAKAQGGAS